MDRLTNLFLLRQATWCCRRYFHKLPEDRSIALASLQLSKNTHLASLTYVSPSFSFVRIPTVHNLSGRRFATDSEKTEEKAAPGTINIPFWARLLIVSGVAGAAYYMICSAQKTKQLEEEEFRYKEFKKIDLGGDWTLTDHNGKKRSSTEFKGQWVIMYMGFTHCPDICPEEMEKLGQIVLTFDADPKLPNLQPVFITLDPERDSPSVIKDYLKEFKSPRIVGFTGSEAEIKEVAKKFRAYYGKGERNADNDYIVDHTIITYLINPKGEFVNYYDRTRTAEQVVESIKKHVQKFVELEARPH